MRTRVFGVALVAAAFGQFPHITVLDCGTDSVVASLECVAIGIEPVAFGANSNHVYATSAWTLWVVDCSTNTILDQEDGDFEIYGSRYAHDTTDNKLYCPSYRGVVVYDCRTMSVTDTIAIDGYVGDMVWSASGNKLYIASRTNSSIYVINCTSDSVTKIIGPLSDPPVCLCPVETAGRLYFCQDKAVGVVDMAGDSILPEIPLHEYIYLLLWNPARQELYASAVSRPQLNVIDCAGDTVTDSFPCPEAQTWSLNTRDSRLYVCGDEALYTLDLGTRTVTDTLPFLLNKLVWDSIDNKLYGLRAGCMVFCDTLVVVDCSTNTVGCRLLLPDLSAVGLVWSPSVNKLYVGGDNWVGAVSSKQPSPVANGPRLPTLMHSLPAGALAFDAVGRRVLNPQPGIHFLRERAAAPARKVIIQR